MAVCPIHMKQVCAGVDTYHSLMPFALAEGCLVETIAALLSWPCQKILWCVARMSIMHASIGKWLHMALLSACGYVSCSTSALICICTPEAAVLHVLSFFEELMSLHNKTS